MGAWSRGARHTGGRPVTTSSSARRLVERERHPAGADAHVLDLMEAEHRAVRADPTNAEGHGLRVVAEVVVVPDHTVKWPVKLGCDASNGAKVKVPVCVPVAQKVPAPMPDVSSVTSKDRGPQPPRTACTIQRHERDDIDTTKLTRLRRGARNAPAHVASPDERGTAPPAPAQPLLRDERASRTSSRPGRGAGDGASGKPASANQRSAVTGGMGDQAVRESCRGFEFAPAVPPRSRGSVGITQVSA
jgi:hypothetical protein